MNDLSLSAYEYDLPKELIAQTPLDKRDASRLLVLEKNTGKISHRSFADITKYFSPGDCLAVNRTKVVPAKLFGNKASGGRVEALFLSPAQTAESAEARVLLKPFIGAGKKIFFPGGLTAQVEYKTPDGETVLRLEGADPRAVLESYGVMPLPPYIKRRNGAEKLAGFDRERYQTVFAEESGSVAAPTAGLHFTEGLLKQVESSGAAVARVTLHVGWGTFRPVTAENIADHRMLPESYEISPEAAVKLQLARSSGKRVIAVGTTSVRTLETAASLPGFGEKGFRAGSGQASMFIYPGYKFMAVSGMVTNFHLPHSTPLAMVCALAGRKAVLKAYAEAIKEKYRFYSYGDAMLIL